MPGGPAGPEDYQHVKEMFKEHKAVREKIKQAIKLILCINLPRSLSDIQTTVLVLVGFSLASNK